MIQWSNEVDIDNKWSGDLMKLILITNDLVDLILKLNW